MKKGGNITQNHSGLNMRNKNIPTKEINVYNQYVFTESDAEVMLLF